MSKYIPKVGDNNLEFDSRSDSAWINCGEVVAESETQIVCLQENKLFRVLSKANNFRKISTKADVEREQLKEIVSLYVTKGIAIDYIAQNIQRDGFTIPKKVKRSDVFKVLKSNMNSCSSSAQVHDLLDLLGDLVESDV